jgi:twitching motility two-component system response regulator PilH
MNGFQATRTLTRDPATSAVPIVMITTKSMETDRVWGLRQGARAFITKPVNDKELLACINDLLPSAT